MKIYKTTLTPLLSSPLISPSEKIIKKSLALPPHRNLKIDSPYISLLLLPGNTTDIKAKGDSSFLQALKCTYDKEEETIRLETQGKFNLHKNSVKPIVIHYHQTALNELTLYDSSVITMPPDKWKNKRFSLKTLFINDRAKATLCSLQSLELSIIAQDNSLVTCQGSVHEAVLCTSEYSEINAQQLKSSYLTAVALQGIIWANATQSKFKAFTSPEGLIYYNGKPTSIELDPPNRMNVIPYRALKVSKRRNSI